MTHDDAMHDESRCATCRALRALPALEPRAGFDARVLAAFFAAQPATAVRRAARTARRLRQLAVGAAASWGVVGAIMAVWVLAGGGAARLIEGAAGLLGPAAAQTVHATRVIAESLAGFLVSVRIAGDLMAVLRPALVAVGRALHAPEALALTLALSALTMIAARGGFTRLQRRRTHDVHALFVLA